MTHVTWSNEEAGLCPKCKSVPVLIYASAFWSVDLEDIAPDGFDEVEVGEEITAHYCKTCGVLTSLSLNALSPPA